MMEIVFVVGWLVNGNFMSFFLCYVLVMCICVWDLNEQIVGKSMWWKSSQNINIRKRRRREPDNDDIAHNSPDNDSWYNDSRNDDGIRKKGKFWCIYVSSIWSMKTSPSSFLPILEANYRIFPFFPSRITVCRKCWMHLAFV